MVYAVDNDGAGYPAPSPDRKYSRRRRSSRRNRWNRRVEHPRHVLKLSFIFHRREVVAWLAEFTEVDFTTGLRIPQPQCVSGVGVVTGDDLIIRDGQNLFRLSISALLPSC